MGRKGLVARQVEPLVVHEQAALGDLPDAVPQEVLGKIVQRIPVGRLGHADEIARAVKFLCSEDAGFVTGSTMSVNGGQHMY